MSERLWRTGILLLGSLVFGGIFIVLIGVIVGGIILNSDAVVMPIVKVGFSLLGFGLVLGGCVGAVHAGRWVMQGQKSRGRTRRVAQSAPEKLPAVIVEREPHHEPYEWMN